MPIVCSPEVSVASQEPTERYRVYILKRTVEFRGDRCFVGSCKNFQSVMFDSQRHIAQVFLTNATIINAYDVCLTTSVLAGMFDSIPQNSQC